MFSFFARLPVEVQDMIWDLALVGWPIAQFADIKRTPIGLLDLASNTHTPKNLAVTFCRSRAPADGDVPPALLTTCVRSRAAVMRYRPPVDCVEIAETRRPSYRRRGMVLAPAVSITSADLVVLAKDYWVSECQTFGIRAVEGLLHGEGNVHYLAVQCSAAPVHPDLLVSLRRATEGLLTAFPRLRVLYWVVEPNECAGGVRPWPECHWLPRYLAKYGGGGSGSDGDGGSSSPEPLHFQCGTRDFYELPVEHVAQLGGLEPLIHMLAYAMERGHRIIGVNVERQSFPSLRLMTWREMSTTTA